MTDFRDRYKRVGFGREDPGINRALRSQRHNEERREKRSEFYGARRDLDQDDSVEIEEQQGKRQSAASVRPEADNKVEEKIDEACLNRLKQLEKWREERNRRRQLEKKVAKPVFKVGVVHHRVYSPPIKKKEAPSPPTKLCKHKENVPEPLPKRITNATKKRLEIKAMANQQKRENMRSKKKKETIEKVPLAPKDHQFKAPVGVNAIPLFGRRALEPSQENVQLELSDNCLPSKTDLPVNVTSLCKSITDFTFSLLESSSVPKSQLNESLNESANDEMEQENEEEKNEDMDVEDNLPTTFNRRRSTRIFNDSMIKKPQTPAKIRKIRVNFNLLDQSLSNLNDNESPNTRRTTRFSKMIQNGIDQSLIKFSPRQSMRFAKEAAKSLSSEEVPSKNMEESPSPKKTEKSLSPEKTAKSLPSEETEKSSPTEEIAKSSLPEETAQSSSPEESASSSFNQSLSPSDKPPAFYSPFVVASRGKSGARKELHKRRSSIAPDSIPTKDTVMKNLNISIEEEERTAQYYKYLLNQEIDRLNGLCDSWDVVKNDEATPEDIHYLIQAAIGQTQLLINKKFKRFQSLVQDCETGKGEMLVTCKDLQGFWEMTFIEVENCNDRFKKLEELKANNWVDEEARKAEEKLKKKPAVKKSAAVKKKPMGKSSSIRAHILAARKKMQGPNEDVEMEEPKIQEQKEIEKQAADDNVRKTPTRNSPRISTPGSKSLLRKVQMSQTRKLTKSPLITMKINKLCKTPEVRLDDSIVYINSDRTPARSILKSNKEDVAVASIAKSTNKVFFKEQPMEIQLFDADSESLEVINEVDVPTGKRLNFEDSFSDEESKKEDNNDGQIAKSKKDDKRDSPTGSKSNFRKELYLNSQGIVCERLIPLNEDPSNTSKLKTRNATKLEKAHDMSIETVEPATPNRQRKINAKKHLDINDVNMETVTPTTPRTQPTRNSKKLAENLDTSTAAAPATPNSQKRKNSKKQIENLNLSLAEPITPNSVITVEPATPSRQRKRNAKKHLDINDVNMETVTPTTPRTQPTRNSKKLAGNLDTSTAAEPTTPNSQRRRKSKKQIEIGDLITVEPATPNSQRRSLRIRKLHDKTD